MKELCLLFPSFACLKLQSWGAARAVLGLSLAALGSSDASVTMWLVLCFRWLLHLPAREK